MLCARAKEYSLVYGHWGGIIQNYLTANPSLFTVQIKDRFQIWSLGCTKFTQLDVLKRVVYRRQLNATSNDLQIVVIAKWDGQGLIRKTSPFGIIPLVPVAILAENIIYFCIFKSALNLSLSSNRVQLPLFKTQCRVLFCSWICATERL